MWEIEKATLITNNDRVKNKYQDKINIVYVKTYEEALIKTRDMVYDRHVLLTHPQASSLKPNQTPYRSVIVYPSEGNDNMNDIMLIEKCITTFNQWQEICKTPIDYESKVANDFKTIDLSVIDNVITRI